LDGFILKNILIVFGSRFGNTKEVAAEIAKVAEEAGTKVDVVDLKETKRKDWPSVENYDGIIVGSGVKIMKWTRQPLAFLKKNKNQLNKKTLGLFATAAFALVDQSKIGLW